MDVWKINLSCSTEHLTRGLSVLSADEAQRTESIGSEPMRRAFVLARIALRALLGRYLCLEPASIRFTYGTRGKPAVCGSPDLCFSASRSGAVAAFAICLNTPVGIDVEALRTIPQMDRVAERMFSQCERQQLSRCTPEQLHRAFLACWTRKEAYAKAIGDGILAAFDKFCVDPNPHEQRPGLHFHEVLLPQKEWSVHDLYLSDEHTAALAYRGPEQTISIFESASVDQLLPTPIRS